MYPKIRGKNSSVISIHQCFNLIYFLLYHTGCLGCKIKSEKVLYYYNRYKLYGYIYRLIYLTGLIGGFVYKMSDKQLSDAIMGQLSPVIKVILTFECVLCPFSYVGITLYLDCNRNKYVKLANTLQELDEKMKTHFPNIQWNYEKSRRKYSNMTVVLYGFYVIVSTIYIFNIAHCACGWFSSTAISICYACVTGAPAGAGFLFIGNMDLLRLRFRLLRKLLRQQFMNTSKQTRLRNFADVSKFKLLENYFMEYTNLIIPLNQVFCIVSGSGFFHDFAVITSLGYLMCSKALDSKSKVHEYIFISLFMAPRIYKVINTAIYGYATQKEQRNCCRELSEIGYCFKSSPLMQDHMEAFQHWRLHNNYHVTVGKILNCNLSLIYLILNSVMNYVIILIQLQFQQNNITNRVINNEIINTDTSLN